MINRVVEIATRVALVGIGVFTAVPVTVLFRQEQLESYGIVDPDPMVLTLLQHRGVFQLLAGAALVWVAFRPDLRIPIAAGVIVAKGAALLLTFSRPEAQEQASRFIQGFDVVSVAVLLAIIVASAGKSLPGQRRADASMEVAR
ncbi:hypothetical protein [Kribbella swartbergensis]